MKIPPPTLQKDHHEICKPDLIKCIVAAILLSMAISVFIRPVIVRGPSMEPTFYDGDYLITSLRSDIQRNDVIVLWEEDKYIIKRVIGMEGDEITFKDNHVYTNGEDKGAGDGYDVTVGTNEYYVMGDNREISLDSRAFGTVQKDAILGKVVLRLLPNPATDFPQN